VSVIHGPCVLGFACAGVPKRRHSPGRGGPEGEGRLWVKGSDCYDCFPNAQARIAGGRSLLLPRCTRLRTFGHRWGIDAGSLPARFADGAGASDHPQLPGVDRISEDDGIDVG